MSKMSKMSKKIESVLEVLDMPNGRGAELEFDRDNPDSVTLRTYNKLAHVSLKLDRQQARKLVLALAEFAGTGQMSYGDRS